MSPKTAMRRRESSAKPSQVATSLSPRCASYASTSATDAPDLARAGARRGHPQRAAVHRQADRLDGLEAVAREQAAQRRQRVEGQVLVVERVPLQELEQVARVHDLEHEHAVGREQRVGRLEDRARVRVVGEDVRAADDRRLADLLAQLGHEVGAERAGDEVAALRPAQLGDVAGEVDADSADPALLERRDERAVVGAELDDRPGRVGLLQPVREAREVAHEAGDRAGLERVVLKEDRRVDRIGDLHARARLADRDLERVRALCRDLLGGQEAAGQRHVAEVEERAHGPTVTGAAACGHDRLLRDRAAGGARSA